MNNDENSKKNFLRGKIAGFAIAGVLFGGIYVASSGQDDPYEAADNLINSIESHSEKIETGEYDLGKIVDKVNEHRSWEEKVNDYLNNINEENDGLYQRSFDLFLEGLDDSRRIYASSEAFYSLDYDKKKEFLENKTQELEKDNRKEVFLGISKDFSANEYEKVISELFKDSNKKHDNNYAIYKNLLEQEKEEGVENLKQFRKELNKWYEEKYDEGKEKLTDFFKNVLPYD